MKVDSSRGVTVHFVFAGFSLQYSRELRSRRTLVSQLSLIVGSNGEKVRMKCEKVQVPVTEIERVCSRGSRPH